MKDGPIHLIVRDAAAPTIGGMPWWAPWALVLGAGVVAAIGVVAMWRWFSRRRDPYERLLDRVCDLAGLAGRDRTALMVKAGGEAKRAVGLLLVSAARKG